MHPSFITSSLIACPHAFSTRLGGVSEGVFASLNLGQNRGDSDENVIANWRIFGAAAGIPTERFVYGKQVHGANVRVVGLADAYPICDERVWEPADGYVTNVPGLPLVVFTADCAPLLLYDGMAGVVAAVHCGWRSTAADIEGVTLAKMRALGAHERDIRAAVGPCIGPCCFETGAEIPEAFTALLGGETDGLWRAGVREGKYMVDLPGVVLRRLEQLGLRRENIEWLGECTMCRPERYWSHRYTNGVRGSQANIIML